MDDGRLRWQSGFNAVAQLDGQGTASLFTLSQAKRSLSKQIANSLQAGTGSAQIDALIVREDTLAGSGFFEYDLFDGTVLDIFDQATILQSIKFIWIGMIANPGGATSASSITIGNAVAEPLQLWFGSDTHTQTIYPEGPPFCQGNPAGLTVDALNNRVRVLNNDAVNQASYVIVIGGVRA